MWQSDTYISFDKLVPQASVFIRANFFYDSTVEWTFTTDNIKSFSDASLKKNNQQVYQSQLCICGLYLCTLLEGSLLLMKWLSIVLV